MTVRPLGLMQDISAAMRKHIVLVLDMLMAEVKERIAGDPEAIERDLVDEVARWAARQDERLFPSGRPATGREVLALADALPSITSEQLGEVINGLNGDEPQPLIHEPTNGKWLCPVCGSAECVPSLCLRSGGETK